MNERWLSVHEIAAHLGVNAGTVYKWIERKGLPAHKVGRLWKFMASGVDAWVRGEKTGGGMGEALDRGTGRPSELGCSTSKRRTKSV